MLSKLPKIVSKKSTKLLKTKCDNIVKKEIKNKNMAKYILVEFKTNTTHMFCFKDYTLSKTKGKSLDNYTKKNLKIIITNLLNFDNDDILKNEYDAMSEKEKKNLILIKFIKKIFNEYQKKNLNNKTWYIRNIR